MLSHTQLFGDGNVVRTIVMAALLVLGSSAIAQETSRSILVLDGSGSMWGQIDGTAKITIAQDVVSELMGTMPETQELGLTVYGHRKKGDCSDIQTLVEPGLGNRPAIVDAVRAIKPKGKTPMIDAVKVAAEALRFTEEEATVVLISDGFETCNADPCAAARALDDAGVNFTAHVVGFDVDDADALAQMQCIADETGGQFVTAADASELTRALDTVVAAPEPIITTVTFNARLDSEDGAMITDPISWTVIATDETTDLSAQDNPISFELTEGSYEVVALWSAEKQEITKQFVTAASAAREITLVFESPDVSATIIAPETAQISSTIEVAWDGPNDKGDYVGIGLVNAEGSSAWENYTYTAEGSPLQLLMPPNTGAYAITYFQSSGRALASAPITLEPVKVEITAPEIATAGETIELSWTGVRANGRITPTPKKGRPCNSKSQPLRVTIASPISSLRIAKRWSLSPSRLNPFQRVSPHQKPRQQGKRLNCQLHLHRRRGDLIAAHASNSGQIRNLIFHGAR